MQRLGESLVQTRRCSGKLCIRGWTVHDVSQHAITGPLIIKRSPHYITASSRCEISSVNRRIQNDIIVVMTEGFIDFDATGTRRRIFLDRVGFLGDTPA